MEPFLDSPPPSHLQVVMLPSGLLQKLATWILVMPVFYIFWVFQAKAQEESPIHFETQARGILKAHCFHCHGEAEQREAGLDLSTASR